MDFATAFKIVIREGRMVYTTILAGRCYIAVAKPISRLRSDKELFKLNQPTVRYNNVQVGHKKYLERIDLDVFFKLGTVTKDHEQLLKERWIAVAKTLVGKSKKEIAA